MRFHQGWWRAFVLCEDPGPHPSDPEQLICSGIHHGDQTGHNFLSASVFQAVQETLNEREHGAKGLIAKERLFNNLLSSQPLCFNFFGDMKQDLSYAVTVLGRLFPGVTKVFSTSFEFAPDANYTADNSAFDVAFQVEAMGRRGIIGLECKYVDAFSQKEHDKPAYRDIYEKSGAFNAKYEDLVWPKFNQLFRNQLIAESLVLSGEYHFSISGLFCHPEDEKALRIAEQFRSCLKSGEAKFRIVTYWDFIESVLTAQVTRAQREFAMVLWARYLGARLSTEAFQRVS
jgi:hypothetical protein